MIYLEDNLKIEITGESHSPEICVRIEGLPKGFEPDLEMAEDMLARRRAGKLGTTPRVEEDKPEIKIEGDAICAAFKNKNVDSSPYEGDLIPRPGHGDYPYMAVHGKTIPGGPSSARKTVGLVFAGALCKQLLAERGIYINAKVLAIGGVDAENKEEVEKLLACCKENKDSVGGLVGCTVYGLPVGFGPQNGSKLESGIAKCVFNLPAVKGLEFGSGFAAASMFGSENNDPFYFNERGEVKMQTNNAGGVLGGKACGAPLQFTVAIKPVPSVGKEQQSVNLTTRQNVTIALGGRHDICAALRAPSLVESAAAIAIANIILGEERK